MGTYDTRGGTPRHDPMFDDDPPCGFCGQYPTDCQCRPCPECTRYESLMTMVLKPGYEREGFIQPYEWFCDVCGIAVEPTKEELDAYHTFVDNAEELARGIEPPILECMSEINNGAHWSISDWYKDLEVGIKEALRKRKTFTTGWYSSKKEIASGKLTLRNSTLVCEASVSDDFDTEGYGIVRIPFTENLDTIREALNDALYIADENRVDNSPVSMYAILRNGRWIETYLLDIGGDGCESPPGDYYEEWGFQGDSDLPKDVKQKIEEHILKIDTAFQVGNYTVRRLT